MTELNQLVQPDYTGKYLWATDKTGVYDATTNEDGWGAPNFELSESAIGVVAIARDEFRTVLPAISPRWKYNNSAVNETENVFQMSYIKDSIIDVYMIRLMVSLDNIVTVNGVVLLEGHYYYNAVEGSVYKIENSASVLVENMVELVDKLPILSALDGNTISILCTDAYIIKLAIDYNKQYKAYVVKRTAGCDDIKTELFNMLNFKEDMIGARRQYVSGLFSKSQSTIETLTEEQNIQ